MDYSAKYLLTRRRYEVTILRINMFLRLGLIKGIPRIKCRLRLLELTKKLFILELEQGKTINIPAVLSQEDLSHSFRYYEGIIHTIQQKTSLDFKVLLTV